MRTTIRRFGRGVLVGLIAALAIGACNQPVATSSPSTPAATATPAAPTASPPPSATAQATPAATPAQTPTGTAGAGGDLADEIPDVVAGVSLTKVSVNGDDLSDLPTADALIFEGMIEAAGIDPASLQAVSATGEGLAVIGIRAEGAPVQAVGDAFIGQIVQLTGGTAEVTDITIAGASVKRISSAAFGGNSFYVFLRDDIVFAITSTDQAVVAEAIGDLL